MIDVNPRELVVQYAQNKLGQALLSVIKEHDLTYGEVQLILAQEQLRWASYQTKAERNKRKRTKKVKEDSKDASKNA